MLQPPAQTDTTHALAVGFMTGEMFSATLSNVLLRVAATDSAPQITLFFRLVIAAAILAPLLLSSPQSRKATSVTIFDRHRLGRYFLCGTVSYAASIAWLYALLHLPIALATCLFFTTALFMGVMGRWVLAEAFTARNWIALAVGLIGVAFVVRPSLEGIHVDGVIAALVAAALAALGKTLLKSLGDREPPTLSAFLRLAPVIPVAAVLAFQSWATPAPGALAAIAVAAVLLALGHAAIARGYRIVSLSQAAALEYLRLLFATTAGILVFGEALDAATLLGGAVILGAAFLGASRTVRLPARRTAANAPLDNEANAARSHHGS